MCVTSQLLKKEPSVLGIRNVRKGMEVMAIHNRDPLLNRLANALGRPRKTQEVERPQYSVQPQYEVLQTTTPDELVDVLEKQCEVIHTNFVKTTTAALTTTLRSCLSRSEERRVGKEWRYR